MQSCHSGHWLNPQREKDGSVHLSFPVLLLPPFMQTSLMCFLSQSSPSAACRNPARVCVLATSLTTSQILRERVGFHLVFCWKVFSVPRTVTCSTYIHL